MQKNINPIRDCSIYDLKLEPLSEFPLMFSCDEDLRDYVKNLYLVCKNINGFQDKLWSRSNTIIDVAKWLYDFIQEKYKGYDVSFENELSLKHYHSSFAEEYYGIDLAWTKKITNKKVKTLCHEAVHSLFINGYPFDYGNEWNDTIEYVYSDIFEMEELISSSEDEDEIENAKASINHHNLILEEYQDSVDEFNIIFSSKINPNLKKDLKKLYSNKAILKKYHLQLYFIKRCIDFIELEVDPENFKRTEEQGLYALDVIRIYWDMDSYYFERKSEDIDCIANEVGVNSFYDETIITKDKIEKFEIPVKFFRIIKSLKSLNIKINEQIRENKKRA